MLEELRAGGADAQIASGGGRMHMTMDRYEADWPMVERGWRAHVLGEAEHAFGGGVEAVKALRALPKPNDQYLPSFVVRDTEGAPVGAVHDGDAVVLFNFRADRMVEISKAFEYEAFTHFDRVRWPKARVGGPLQSVGIARAACGAGVACVAGGGAARRRGEG